MHHRCLENDKTNFQINSTYYKAGYNMSLTSKCKKFLESTFKLPNVRAR